MSAGLARRRAGVLVLALLPVALATRPVQAQRPVGWDGADTAATTAPAWLRRLDVSARYGTFLPTGRSELYALLDDALVPGARVLRPRLVGGALHLRLTDRWGLLLGAEGGGSTVASASRVGPEPASGQVRQQTSLALTSAQYVGAE
ncbi:MAG TPA: hypothetical protein VF048_05205, partial [Gemmatimonadaceae bacterium]